MTWKKRDILRLDCGRGICCWQKGTEYDAVTRSWNTKACTAMWRDHECTVVALQSFEEGWSTAGWLYSRSLAWAVVTSFGVAFFVGSKDHVENFLMKNNVIRIMR